MCNKIIYKRNLPQFPHLLALGPGGDVALWPQLLDGGDHVHDEAVVPGDVVAAVVGEGGDAAASGGVGGGDDGGGVSRSPRGGNRVALAEVDGFGGAADDVDDLLADLLRDDLVDGHLKKKTY